MEATKPVSHVILSLLHTLIMSLTPRPHPELVEGRGVASVQIAR